MRIVVLEPFLSEIIGYLGLEADIVGVPQGADYPEGLNAHVITNTGANKDPEIQSLAKAIASTEIDIAAVAALEPDIIICSPPESSPDKIGQVLALYLSKRLGRDIKVLSVKVHSLQSIISSLEKLGESLGKSDQALSLSHRLKAQLMDWGANFNARTRNKKVSVLASFEPLQLAAQWVSDLVKGCSAIPQTSDWENLLVSTSWKEIEKFKPDVLIIAPYNQSLNSAIKLFPKLEKLPEWESLPAVKRGEVIFMDGVTLYRPGPRLLDGAGILVSAIAGLESGYITARDSFFRLRWLELNRHKL